MLIRARSNFYSLNRNPYVSNDSEAVGLVVPQCRQQTLNPQPYTLDHSYALLFEVRVMLVSKQQLLKTQR